MKAILDELFQEAMNRKPIPTYPKIGTLKAMVDLGDGWHTYNEVQRELVKVQWSGNIYSLYLARVYPDLIEVDPEKHVRIRPALYPVTKRLVKGYAEKILQAVAKKKQELGK